MFRCFATDSQPHASDRVAGSPTMDVVTPTPTLTRDFSGSPVQSSQFGRVLQADRLTVELDVSASEARGCVLTGCRRKGSGIRLLHKREENRLANTKARDCHQQAVDPHAHAT